MISESIRERLIELLSESQPLKDFELLIADAVAAEREACAQACEVIADNAWDQYKGRGAHAPNNPRRADPEAQSESDGAWLCAKTIRARP
jgi:hypothetical protein